MSEMGRDRRPLTALPIVDVFTSLPIEGAVFTTYTLSLAWFETHLLRALERAGATQILLLADPAGVNASLGEGLVTGPGVRYAVESLEAPNGAFHAKVGVMWSRDCLLITVGSGNLTYAGMQRNLECWEVLTAGVPSSEARQLTRSLAEDASAFFSFIQARLEPGGRAFSTLGTAIRAVTTWFAKLPAVPSSVRWLDSTREPIGEQLCRYLGTHAHRRLQVLSPFHDRDGAAVDRLAERLGATAVEILYTGSTTTYPLGRKAQEQVVARRVEIEDQTRPLHAKLLHVVDQGRAHVMSGSANATSQALWTVGNIEVSLLRQGTFEDLLPTVPGTPEVKLLEYKKPAPRLLTIQWARAADDHVRIHMRWIDDAPPRNVLVGFVDSLEAPFALEWPDDGIVRVRLPGTFNPLRPRALRVEIATVKSGVRAVARSWVAFDDLLNSSREFRAALSAWNRLLLGEDTEEGDDEDDAVLLRMFAEEHAHTIEAVGSGLTGRRRVPAQEEAGEEGDDEVSIPLRLIEALTRLPLPSGSTAMRSESILIDDVERAMRAAFDVLGEPAATDEGEDEPGDGLRSRTHARPRLPRSVRQALDDFERAFVEAANAIGHAPAKPTHVLAYASLCVRLVLRYRLKDGEIRAPFWSSIATLVRTLLCPLANRAALISLLRAPGATLPEDAAQLLALLVALSSWHDEGGRLDGEKLSVGQARRTDVLREALSALDRATETIPQPSALPRSLDQVFPEQPEILTEVLARMRRVPSPSDRALDLKAHLEAVARGDAQPINTGPYAEIACAAPRIAPLFVAPWIVSCPRCHQVLAEMVQGRLLLREPMQCRNARCSRWLVPSESA